MRTEQICQHCDMSMQSIAIAKIEELFPVFPAVPNEMLSVCGVRQSTVDIDYYGPWLVAYWRFHGTPVLPVLNEPVRAAFRTGSPNSMNEIR
jgi:hypothetical protein